MLKWTGQLFHHVFVVACALFFLQCPLFMQAYQQQLIGHVAEIKWHISLMRKTAAQSDKTLEQYIQKFITNKDPDFSKQGSAMQGMVHRGQKLSKALAELQRAPLYVKPWIFLVYADWDVVRSTAATFEPGIPFTVEGGVYAFIGILLGFLLCSFFKLSRIQTST